MDRRSDWVVVFVHGIGSREPGATLQRFASALVDYALARHGPGSRVERGEDGWVVHLMDGADVRRWRLVEVHWDDVVAPPTYRRLLRWLVLVAPWMLHADALLWSQRRPRTPRRAPLAWWLTIGLSVWWMRLLLGFLRGMALLTAGAVAQLVLSIIGLIGLVPALRAPARWVQRRLVGSVGDSFAYLYDAGTWSRIEQRLVDRVAAASSEADRVAVVTHSQGTAVMHRALANGSMPNVVMAWVSLGSGLQKLAALQVLTTRALVGWAVLRVAALGFFFASIPFWEYASDPATGELELSQLVVSVLMVTIIALSAPYPGIRRLKTAVERVVVAPLPAYKLRWLDLYSFHDPVPGGPMPGSNGPTPTWRPTSREVFNEGSYRRDHNAYTGNVEHVIAPIHDLLAPTDVDALVARHVVERRVRRVRARTPLCVLMVATGLALATPVIRIAPWPAGGVAVVAAVWLSTVILDSTWKRWNKQDTALAATRPGPASPVHSTVGVIAAWSVVASIAESLATNGVDLDQVGGLLRLASLSGNGLTLVFAPLVIGLIVTADRRAYNAARRVVDPPPADPGHQPTERPNASSR
jgi:hypothetical protein